MNTFRHLAVLFLALLASNRLFAQSNAPANLRVTSTAFNQVVLAWDDKSTNEVRFEIERKGFTDFVKIGEVSANVVTYTDNAVSGSGTYTYRIKVIFARTADVSNELLVNTPAEPPTTPTSLAATVQGNNLIRVTWTNPGAGTATDFLLERGTASGGPFNQIAVVPYSRTPEYNDNLALPGTQYCYRVRARGPGGTSTFSNVDCKATPTAPTNIRNLQANATGSSAIRLTWEKYGKESGIDIERKTGRTGGWSRITSTLADNGEYTDNGLAANTEYCYRIIESGRENSAEVCATTQQAAPNAPARLTANAVSNSQINVQWTDVSNNETGFQVERADSPTAPFTKIADPGQNATSYEDKSVRPSQQYCYRVRAVNSVGPSGFTDVQCATTLAPPVGVPQNLVALAVSATQINLTWTGVAGATSYQLERSPNGNDSWTKIADPPGNATSYEDKNLTPNTRYYYRIRAVINGNAGDFSNRTDALTPDVPPTAPARLVATAVAYNRIDLQWADLSGNESGFQLERSPSGTGGWIKIADVGQNATTYSDQGVQPLTQYFYRIRAVNAAGPSGYSDPADATTPVGPPAIPQNLVATAVSTTQINLTWNAVTTATNILIERSPNGTDTWNQIADVPGNTTTYEDKNLTRNTRYFYRIRAKNGSGTSLYSDVTNAQTPDAPPVAPARLTATAVSFSQINLTWTDLSANESGFEVERGSSTTGSFTNVTSLPANATSYEDKNLTDATQYCYRVRAVNPAGPSPYTEPVCATTPLAPPATPTGLRAAVFDYDQIKLTWTPLGPKAVTVIIERATNPNGPFTEINQQSAGQMGYTDMGLKEFTTYYYRIKAVNAAGMSEYTNAASARIEEIIIAIEDELATHTTLLVSDRRLHVITNWFSTMQTTIQLHTATGQSVLTDNRKVRPAD